MLSRRWCLRLLAAAALVLRASGSLRAADNYDEQRVTDLAARAKVLLARDEELKAKRHALDEEVSQILEKERVAAKSAQEAAAAAPQNEDAKKEADAAMLRWQESRREMEARLKELEPRIAEVTAAEKTLNAEKAQLQEEARVEAARLPPDEEVAEPDASNREAGKAQDEKARESRAEDRKAAGNNPPKDSEASP